MVIRAYCIYDSVSGTYGIPFYSQSDMLAKRSFSNLLADPSSVVSLNSHDFSLYSCGSFNDENGEMLPVTAPQLICKAADFKKE